MSSAIFASGVGGAHGERRLVVGERRARLLHQRADVVVDRPHHLARSLDPVLLEEGEELVLLAQVVLVDLEQAVEHAGESGLEPLPFLTHRGLADLLRDLAQ